MLGNYWARSPRPAAHLLGNPRWINRDDVITRLDALPLQRSATETLLTFVALLWHVASQFCGDRTKIVAVRIRFLTYFLVTSVRHSYGHIILPQVFPFLHSVSGIAAFWWQSDNTCVFRDSKKYFICNAVGGSKDGTLWQPMAQEVARANVKVDTVLNEHRKWYTVNFYISSKATC